MIFNHGNNDTSELHFGVPMIMASHGYFVVSPNHVDGSSIYSQDADGNDVWFYPADGEDMVHKENGKAVGNPKFWKNV